MMEWYQLTLRWAGRVVSPPRGDTLFGQLCWALCERYGEPALNQWLQGYRQGKPFALLSDPLPADAIPQPAVPLSLLGAGALPATERKALKRRKLLPMAWVAQKPVNGWNAPLPVDMPLWRSGVTHHNSINRITGTTGASFPEGASFDPFQVESRVFDSGRDWRVYLLLDPARISPQQVHTALTDVGLFGYGKDATTGAGKYRVTEFGPFTPPAHPEANALLTLAPCAPQGQQWNSGHCYYRPFTRFGRHGSRLAVRGMPYKAPLLLADSGALLARRDSALPAWVGQGLGGDGSLSAIQPETVHQGYAPVLAVHCRFEQQEDNAA